MLDILERHYREVVSRIKKVNPEFDETKFHILIIEENNLDGTRIESCTISMDRRWICVPFPDEQCDLKYKPVCLEVIGEYETYFSNGEMSFRKRIFILNKEK